MKSKNIQKSGKSGNTGKSKNIKNSRKSGNTGKSGNIRISGNTGKSGNTYKISHLVDFRSCLTAGITSRINKSTF